MQYDPRTMRRLAMNLVVDELDRPIAFEADNKVLYPFPTLAADSFGDYTELVGPVGTNLYVPRTLLASGIAIGRPPSGTVGANGDLDLDTSTTIGGYALSKGAYLHFPTGALYSGSVAGFYWTVMTDGTNGTVYDNRLGSKYPTEAPSPLVPIVSDAIGTYTPSTSRLDLPSLIIPGGLMGKNGSLRISSQWSQTASAYSKTHGFGLGTSTYLENEAVTDRKSLATQVVVMNTGGEDAQLVLNNYGYNTSWACTGGETAQLRQDTSVNFPVWPHVQCSNTGNALEFLILRGWVVEVLPFP